MFKIFKYKHLYNEVCDDLINQINENTKLESLLNSERELTQKLTQKLEKQNKLLETSNKRIQEKETLRKKNAGKAGGLQRQNNKLKKEKSEMMNLINCLIAENQKLKKLKKKPNINDFRNYFKKG